MNKSEVFITDDDNELMNKVNTLANENKATRKKREITNEEKERLLENLRRGRETSKNNRLEKQKQLVAPEPKPNNPNEIIEQLMKKFENLEAKLTKPAEEKKPEEKKPEEKKPEVKQEVKAPDTLEAKASSQAFARDAGSNSLRSDVKPPEVKPVAKFVPPAPQVKPVQQPLQQATMQKIKKFW